MIFSMKAFKQDQFYYPTGKNKKYDVTKFLSRACFTQPEFSRSNKEF